MFDLIRLCCGAVLRVFRTHRSLMLENLALRKQLAVLKRKHARPTLGGLDKLFWLLARRFWPRWKERLVVVLPETVVRWHRAGFKLYWAMLCKVRKPVGGGRRMSKEIRQLIFQMVTQNPGWGAPRIHGELLMLGFGVSEATISRWMKRAPKVPDPAKRWLAFLRNHREAIAAMDFFTFPTLTFSVLYCFFIIGHDRRRILHCNVTSHPTSAWIAQQLRDAFPFESVPHSLYSIMTRSTDLRCPRPFARWGSDVLVWTGVSWGLNQNCDAGVTQNLPSLPKLTSLTLRSD
jgi:putative transposase